jgi:hypothetical protein
MGSFDPMKVGGARTSPHAPVHRLILTVTEVICGVRGKGDPAKLEGRATRPIAFLRFPRGGGTNQVATDILHS